MSLSPSFTSDSDLIDDSYDVTSEEVPDSLIKTPEIAAPNSEVKDVESAIQSASIVDGEHDDSVVVTWRKKKAQILSSDSESEEDEEAEEESNSSRHSEEQSDVEAPVFENDMKNRRSFLSSTRNEYMPQLYDQKLSHIDENVIEISSTEDEPISPDSLNLGASKDEEVNQSLFQIQQAKVNSLKDEIARTETALRVVKLSELPDKGESLVKRHNDLIKQSKIEQYTLANMGIPEVEKPKPPLTLNQLESGLDAVQPRTFGKIALQTLNVQKTLTMNRLEQIHSSLKNCPDENTFAEDPKGLKVELMPHQKRALSWLMWREHQKPSGGILADDMGLGKTLTMISLILQCIQNKAEGESGSDDENNPYRSDSKIAGGTLVICPASLINQWESEVHKHVKRGLLSIEVHHGTQRDIHMKRLAKYDIVITTYGLAKVDMVKSGPLTKIRWRRIVLDEAHQIKNHKTKTSEAVCSFSARSRWTLTGTPIHNKELDLYSLLKFLRCSPFDDLAVWKRLVANKVNGGQDRLNTVMMSLMLRRTKEQLQNALSSSIPDKKWEIIELTLDNEELTVYQKVLIFSRTLFAEFLYQRANKNHESLPKEATGQYLKMHQKLIKMRRVREVKQHEILVLLLRLRQICCHPFLITGMLHGDDRREFSDDEGEDIDLLEQLNKLDLNDEDTKTTDATKEYNANADAVPLAEASKAALNPNNPVFDRNRKSTKVSAIIKILNEKILKTDDKVIVVSQWANFLRLIAFHLEQERITYDILDGSVPTHKRMTIVDKFNDPKDANKVLLLSLTAGGVGLNLMGANHLILADLHWNPQLEMQARDRIYRLGQTKMVNVYKLITLDTIEWRIKSLQEKKIAMATEMLTGAMVQDNNKLSLADLKLIFNM